MVLEIATGRLSPMPLSISLTASSEGPGDELALEKPSTVKRLMDTNSTELLKRKGPYSMSRD
jgi:hypothetical protein